MHWWSTCQSGPRVTKYALSGWVVHTGIRANGAVPQVVSADTLHTFDTYSGLNTMTPRFPGGGKFTSESGVVATASTPEVDERAFVIAVRRVISEFRSNMIALTFGAMGSKNATGTYSVLADRVTRDPVAFRWHTRRSSHAYMKRAMRVDLDSKPTQHVSTRRARTSLVTTV